MVGSYFTEHAGFAIHAAGRTNPSASGVSVEKFTQVDLCEPSQVERLVRRCPEEVVVNFAARTDVDRIEGERPLGSLGHQGGAAWRSNAIAPEAMASGAAPTNKYLLQVSTDFVFDGEAGPYAESAPRSTYSKKISWYGWTKSEAERRVQSRHPSACILRISYPYRTSFPGKLDFARWMIVRSGEGRLPPLYTDQLITPTWIPDITSAIATLVEARTSGVVHAASPEATTPFEFGRHLLKESGRGAERLAHGSLKRALNTSAIAPRPVKGGLLCRRLAELGVTLTGWREGSEMLARAEASP